MTDKKVSQTIKLIRRLGCAKSGRLAKECVTVVKKNDADHHPAKAFDGFISRKFREFWHKS